MIQIRGKKARCPLCQRELLNPEPGLVSQTGEKPENFSAMAGGEEETPWTALTAADGEEETPWTALTAAGGEEETPWTALAAAGGEEETPWTASEAACVEGAACGEEAAPETASEAAGGEEAAPETAYEAARGNQESRNPVQVRQAASYDDDPFIRLPSPKVSFKLMIRMVTFVCISLEILLGAAQIISGGSGWFLAAMIFVLLAWADFRIAVYYRSNLIRMLTIQGYIIMAACLIIANISKTGSWAVTWVVPLMFCLLIAVTFAAAKAQEMDLHEYILYPAFDVLMSLLQIIPIAHGTNPMPAPAVLCIALMLILVSGLIIFRGRMLREAAEKYLHI